MSREQFTNDVIMFSRITRVACVASLFNMTIDELIDDAYNNEFDDFIIESVNDFNDFIDHCFIHYVH